MLVRRVLWRRPLWQLASSHVFARKCHQAADAEVMLNIAIKMPAHQKKKPQKEPFVKNLFLGTFDTDFLAYPEAQDFERFKEFRVWISHVENCVTEFVQSDQSAEAKAELLFRLRQLCVCLANVDRDYMGMGLSRTELTRLQEVVSVVPWLGTYLTENVIIPVNVISKFGSDSQKRDLLRKIGSGEIVPAICFTEIQNKPSVKDIATMAITSSCDKFWILNGRKTFVTNGTESNLFLVLGYCQKHYEYSKDESQLSVLLVDPTLPGVSCVKEMAYEQETPICTVTFNEVHVPVDNVLGGIGQGVKALMEVYTPGKQNVSGRAIGISRSFINALTSYVLRIRHLDRQMYEHLTVQNIIAQLSSSLYSMESVAYLTAGIIDSYENQDTAIEEAITETFCVNECGKLIYEGIKLVGTQTYLKEKPTFQYFENALALLMFDRYEVSEGSYIALHGFDYLGQHVQGTVKKVRNPFFHPRHMLGRLLRKKKELDMDLQGHLHPSFVQAAEYLTDSVFQLQETCMVLLYRYGYALPERQLELHRIGEITVLIYAMIAVLARASRSYCLGFRNTEEEKYLACIYAHKTHQKIQKLVKEAEFGDLHNGDKEIISFVKTVFDRKMYFPEHPLQRTY